jgi:hypothetical protein
MVLLDTDIMIDILRGYPPALNFLDTLEESEILLPGFVVMELIQGCKNKTEQKKLEKELLQYKKVWPSSKTCDEALIVFSQCHLSHSLGLLDALIGQMAVVLNLPLQTFNQKHYSAIPDLKTIRPYKKNI